MVIFHKHFRRLEYGVSDTDNQNLYLPREYINKPHLRYQYCDLNVIKGLFINYAMYFGEGGISYFIIFLMQGWDQIIKYHGNKRGGGMKKLKSR